MTFHIGTGVFNLGDLKAWILECERKLGVDAMRIAVVPDAGGDWNGRDENTGDSVWEADGSVDLTVERIEA